jgi:hypothetical protein
MRIRAASFLVGVLFVAAPAAALFWVPVGPPGNPAITAMATAKPNQSLPLPNQPSILFAATAGAKVFESITSGVTWVSTGPGLPGDATSLAVRQVFHTGVDSGIYDTTVFAGTSGGGVFRLAPGADFWSASNAGLSSIDIRALAVGGDGVVANSNSAIVYAGTASGLFASSDGGDTWVPKTNGLPDASGLTVNAIAPAPSSPGTVYLGTTLGLFKSVNAGETWSQLDPMPGLIYYTTSIAVDPLAPSRIYVNGAGNPPCYPLCLPVAFIPVSLRSLDGGATWSKMDGLGFNSVRAFAPTSNLPARVFAATTGSGVFESDDAGVTWAPANSGLGALTVNALVIDPVAPSFIFAGTINGVFCAPLGQVNATCVSDAATLCLNGQRFKATVVWRASDGTTGNGQAFPITDNTGAFWFFDPTNLELVVKVLDGRSVNGKWWVFYGSLTNVEFTLTVTDTLTGQVRTYHNPLGQMASFADTSAF